MSKRITVTVDGMLDGRRVDSILKNHLGFSGNLISKLKNAPNGIMLNGARTKVNIKVKNGDLLSVTIPGEKSSSITPVDIPLDILYEDEDILAVNKPALMATHPSKNHSNDTLANGIMHYFRDKDFSFHVITRLDRETSGVVLVAKNSLAAQILTDDIKNKRIYKEYVAVINGVPAEKSGTISAPIKRKENSGILREVSPEGKEAVTEFFVEKVKNNISFINLRPVTGRTHQLRVHMSFRGHPIYGDDMYGAPQEKERVRLHCRKIKFNHPVSGEELCIEAPIPCDITVLVE